MLLGPIYALYADGWWRAVSRRLLLKATAQQIHPLPSVIRHLHHRPINLLRYFLCVLNFALGAKSKRLGTRTLVALWHWNCLTWHASWSTLHIARCTLLVASCCCTYLLFVVAVVMICDFFPHIDGHLAWVRPSPSPGIRSPPCPCPLSTVAAAGRNYATCRNFTQTEEEEEEEQIKQPSRRRSSYPSFLNSVKVPVTS